MTEMVFTTITYAAVFIGFPVALLAIAEGIYHLIRRCRKLRNSVDRFLESLPLMDGRDK